MNAVLALAVFLALLGAVQVQARWVSRGSVPHSASRKLGHVGLGTVLLASWPLFGVSPGARYFAAAPAFGLALYFLALGVGAVRDKAVVHAAAREGSPRELLTGPLLHVVPFGVLVAVFGPSVVAGSALACLVYGDAMAELAGRRLRTPLLPWSRDKTWGGLAGAWLGGWVGGGAVLIYLGLFDGSGPAFSAAGAWVVGGRLGVVSLVGGLVESVTSGDFDNLTVVAAATAAALLLF